MLNVGAAIVIPRVAADGAQRKLGGQQDHSQIEASLVFAAVSPCRYVVERVHARQGNEQRLRAQQSS